MKLSEAHEKISNQLIEPLGGVTGVILAGGRSRRFGKNKALQDMAGARLIERVIRTMKSAFRSVILITNTPRDYAYLDLPMHEDIVKGLGPLGGIYTGLKAVSEDAGFFVACDMPFLNTSLIHHMINAREGFDAVVPRIDWKMEALHALYTKSCIPPIKELIDAGDYQIIRLFERIRVRYIDEDEIKMLDPELRSFLNINRPEELAGAVRILSDLDSEPD